MRSSLSLSRAFRRMESIFGAGYTKAEWTEGIGFWWWISVDDGKYHAVSNLEKKVAFGSWSQIQACPHVFCRRRRAQDSGTGACVCTANRITGGMRQVGCHVTSCNINHTRDNTDEPAHDNDPVTPTLP